ncbi:MAG: DUF2141 domain-containing protein [Alphaproteobacteria bacterium]|nr:DUF2141 domain-containing protein [Alphaproteobacteria bacterium]
MKLQQFSLFWAIVTLAMVGWMLLAAGLVAPARAQEPGGHCATVVIHIQDVSPRGGMVRLGLYDEARYPDDDAVPVASADVRAETGETVITLNNVPPGIYAIETFQDINSNNKMDTSWIGLPQEPFGFSRDAQPHLSKPGFAKVKFEVAQGMNVQTLHLQNSVSLLASK